MTSESTVRETNRKERTGIVVSDKMNKTIVVEVDRLVRHSQFDKTIRSKTSFKAHDEKNEAKIGDKVRIEETRPISRDKRWRLVEIIAKSKSAEAGHDL